MRRRREIEKFIDTAVDMAQHALQNPEDPSLGFEIICVLPDYAEQTKQLLRPWPVRLWRALKDFYYKHYPRMLRDDEIPF